MEATSSQSLKMFKFQPFVAPDREFIFDVNLCNLWLKFNCHSGQLHRLLPWASNFKPVGREIPGNKLDFGHNDQMQSKQAATP